jgi:hypothetical protein
MRPLARQQRSFLMADADTDPLLLKLSTTTVADSQNFVIPDQGILFKEGACTSSSERQF